MSDAGWLFRQGELVLGPVPRDQILAKIYAGELDGKSEIQAFGEAGFVPLERVEEFRPYLTKADAKRRVDAIMAQKESYAKKRRLIAGGIAVLGMGILGLGLMFVGEYLAVHPVLSAGEDDAANNPLISVSGVVVAPPKGRVADELIEYTGGSKSAGAGSAKSPALANRVGPGPKPAPGSASNDPDGMDVAEVDMGALKAVVAKRQSTLFSCLSELAKAGTRVEIPIEFAVDNSGKVTKLWVDNPDYRDGSIKDCLFRELQKWNFPPQPAPSSLALKLRVGK